MSLDDKDQWKQTFNAASELASSISTNHSNQEEISSNYQNSVKGKNQKNISSGTNSPERLKSVESELKRVESYKKLLENLVKEQSSVLSSNLLEQLKNDPNEEKVKGALTKSAINLKQLNDLLKQHQNFSEDSGNPHTLKGGLSPRSGDAQSGDNVRKSVILSDPCRNCREFQKKCVTIPSIKNCVRCETMNLECTLPMKATSTNELKRQSSDLPEKDELKKVKSVGSNMSAIESLQSRRNSNRSSNSSSWHASKDITQLNKNILPSFGKEKAESLYNKDWRSDQASSINSPNFNNYHPNAKTQYHQNINSQFSKSALHVGSSSPYDINMINAIRLDNISQVHLSDSVVLRKVAENTQFMIFDDFDIQHQLQQEFDSNIIENLVQPHAKILIDIFFKVVHPYFPILHESVFLEKYNQNPKEINPTLLASVFSLAIQWWDVHPVLIGYPKPNVCHKLNELAYRSFFEMVDKPKLSVIQAGLVLLQVRSEKINNWALCSIIVALAEEIGLNIDCTNWKLPKWEIQLRRRIAWAVWFHEKWIALLEGRQPHFVLGQNWTVTPLKAEDLPRTSVAIINRSDFGALTVDPIMKGVLMFDNSPTIEDFSKGVELFKQSISLSIIVSEILNTFFSPATDSIDKIEDVLTLAKPLQLKLKDWYQLLPSYLSTDNNSERKANFFGSLKLMYFAAELTLHRRIICSLGNDTANELKNVCRTAAKSRLIAAIEFVGNLKDENTNAFWYLPTTGCFMLIVTFATLLFVTSETKEEETVYRDLIKKYVWMLKISSKSFDKKKHALDRIHLLLTKIPNLLIDGDAMAHGRVLTQVTTSEQKNAFDYTKSDAISSHRTSNLQSDKNLSTVLQENFLSNSSSYSTPMDGLAEISTENSIANFDKRIELSHESNSSNQHRQAQAQAQALHQNSVSPINKIPIYKTERLSQTKKDELSSDRLADDSPVALTKSQVIELPTNVENQAEIQPEFLIENRSNDGDQDSSFSESKSDTHPG